MTDHTPLTSQDLDEIETRAAHLAEYACQNGGEGDTLAGTDVPALLAEVRRLQQQRKYLITQLAKRDAESGRGDAALREFLGELAASEDQPPAASAAGESGSTR
ncbi:hypothetical protein AB0J81_09295 [Streptomyces bobili]|uniref:hypothetical protein n=1 Tax=Streptomyces bobili TaxID=67280 RepID=UPI0034436273